MTAFISIRACDIGGPCFHDGVAAPISIISVVLMAGLPPPMMITRGSKPLAGVNGSSTEVPYVLVVLEIVLPTVVHVCAVGSKSLEVVVEPE